MKPQAHRRGLSHEEDFVSDQRLVAEMKRRETENLSSLLREFDTALTACATTAKTIDDHGRKTIDSIYLRREPWKQVIELRWIVAAAAQFIQDQAPTEEAAPDVLATSTESEASAEGNEAGSGAASPPETESLDDPASEEGGTP